MSRVGLQPITVPSGTTVEISSGTFTAQGPKGKVSQPLFEGYPVAVEDSEVRVSRPGDSGPERAKHGLLRALLANAVDGVSRGFTRQLDIVGVGYKAQVDGKKVVFSLGYSHPIEFPIPDGIQIAVDKQTHVVVSGIDRQRVGQVAAEIKRLRKPDPYKQKGIRYVGEVLKKKAGKAGATGAK